MMRIKQAHSLKFALWTLVFLGILLLSALPRVLHLKAHWSSDETTWLLRSQAFMLALQDKDWKNTQVSYHPGVTTTWLGGIALWSKYRKALSSADGLIFNPLISPENLRRARLPIALLTVVAILLSAFFLGRLMGGGVAVCAAILLAVDPLFLTQSRRLHTDALAASFLLLSLVFLLLFLEKGMKRRVLLTSGVFFGFACLSKSNALILLLCLPFILIFYRTKFPLRLWFGFALIWLGSAFLIFIAFWPVFWGWAISIAGHSTPIFGLLVLILLLVVNLGIRQLRRKEENFIPKCPEDTVFHRFSVFNIYGKLYRFVKSVIEKQHLVVRFGNYLPWLLLCVVAFCIVLVAPSFFERIKWAATTEHEVAHFFLGEVRNNPGWLFYPLMLSAYSTLLTLPLSIFGWIWLLRKRRDAKWESLFRLDSILWLVVLLFTLCLSVTAKKFSRYLLPAHLMLDILAAIGLVVWVEFVKESSKARWRGVNAQRTALAISVAISIGVLSFQAAPVLACHPYYGTYINPLWKVVDVTQLFTLGDGSGLDLAAQYLNQKPRVKHITVHVSPLSSELFGYYFIGRTVRMDRSEGHLPPDYVVLYIRDVQIGRVNIAKQNGRLEKVIRLNGIDYVWIYRIDEQTE